MSRKFTGPAKKETELKKNARWGECWIRGCHRKSRTLKARWCVAHKKAVRRLQLKLNNIAWRRRIAAGTAGHHVAYRGKATAWAAQNPKQARQVVAAGKTILAGLADFERALANSHP